MITLLNGIKWGLFLAILVGPILLSLVQAGIEKGTRVGLVMGSGVWISDILYILAVYLGLSTVDLPPQFAFYTGIVGGIILISFGLVNFFVKPKQDTADKIIRASTYRGYFLCWSFRNNHFYRHIKSPISQTHSTIIDTKKNAIDA